MSTTATAAGGSKTYTTNYSPSNASPTSPITSLDATISITAQSPEEFLSGNSNNRRNSPQSGGELIVRQDHHNQGIIKFATAAASGIIGTGGGCGGGDGASNISGGGSLKQGHHHHQMNQDLPSLKPELLLNDTGLFTVYCFIKNFIGASGTSAVAIDNKIEQAMDLVKSHLMIAVREEVEVLKEKIAELMDRINQLELENTILKANVSQETLSQLSATIQTAATNPQQQTTATATTQPSSQPVQKPPSQNTNTSNGPVS